MEVDFWSFCMAVKEDSLSLSDCSSLKIRCFKLPMTEAESDRFSPVAAGGKDEKVDG